MNGGACVAAILLAAGSSRRLGRPKQLLPFHGRPLVRALAEELARSLCASVAVVLGAHADGIRPALDGAPITVLTNPSWEEGMASSIRAGIGWAADRGADAALVAVVDQPFLTAAHADALVAAYLATPGLVASRYDAVLGVPAIFDEASFPRLDALRGGEGARRVLRSAAHATAIDWPDGAFDIDTPEDAARLLGV